VSKSISVSIDVSAIPLEPKGAGRYVLELIRALSKKNSEVSLTLFTRKNDSRRWIELAPHARIENIIYDSRVKRILFGKSKIKGYLKLKPTDVFHSPHYSYVSKLGIPQVVTIHDMTFFTRPKDHQLAKVIYFRSQIKRALQSADVIICVSEVTKDLIERYFGKKDNIFVALHAIDTEKFTPEKSDRDESILKNLGLTKPFILYVGTIEPRKNLNTLLKAYIEYKKMTKDEIELVLAGATGWKKNKSLNQSLFFSAPDIKLLGYVPDDVLAALYRQSALFIYPSIEEGFGLPVIEAISCKAKVIADLSHPLKKYFEDCVQFIDCKNYEEIISAIESSLKMTKSLDQGVLKTREFSWDNSARMHLMAYTSCVRKKP
jgi:glycosyltransferase involved in cell wall biosynthesis